MGYSAYSAMTGEVSLTGKVSGEFVGCVQQTFLVVIQPSPAGLINNIVK